MKKNVPVGRLLVLATVMLIGIEPVKATNLGDTEEIQSLRSQYIKAVELNNPEAVGDLVTADFVMLQPNYRGPDTYGRKAYIDYRKSLNPVVKVTIETARVLTCGNEWAWEMGKELTDWKSPQVDYSTSARYVKLLNRKPSGPWQYARVFWAWDVYSPVPTPRPGKLTGTGWGTWEPRAPGQYIREVQEITDFMRTSTRRIVAGGDMVNPMADVMAEADESTGKMLGYGISWEVEGKENYMKQRAYADFELTEELRKYPEEVVVCEANTGFIWGQDMGAGVAKVTGERSTGTGDFIYMVKKQKGKWKLGPHAILFSETRE